jgi:hypothetical protein
VCSVTVEGSIDSGRRLEPRLGGTLRGHGSARGENKLQREKESRNIAEGTAVGMGRCLEELAENPDSLGRKEI